MLVGQNTKIPKYWWGREGFLLPKFRNIGWATAPFHPGSYAPALVLFTYYVSIASIFDDSICIGLKITKLKRLCTVYSILQSYEIRFIPSNNFEQHFLC